MTFAFVDGTRLASWKLVTAAATLAVLILAVASPAPAQSTEEVQALRKAIEALRESQQRIEKELGEIKTLLRGRQAAGPEAEPQNVVLTIDGDQFKGEKGATLVLVDFTDYQ